ncbi:TolC family outer membrane protein [Halomonas tibetensis]|uniref:TolC family outer membrane protein n=1 Tax=Halomonas tibetensis TaxID=2259590 RepID=A0ABV7B6R0_9GAMM
MSKQWLFGSSVDQDLPVYPDCLAAPASAMTLLLLVLFLAPLSVLAQEAEDVPAGEQAMAELSALQEAETTRVIGSLPSLPGLFKRALQHDSELSRQRFELAATEQELPMARSQLMPQVSASASYLWQDSTNLRTELDSDLPPEVQDVRPGEIDETFWQLQLSQPLFSLERWRGMQRAESQVSAAELDLALVERNLALQVGEGYVNAYLASRKLGLLEAQQEALSLQSRQAQRAYDLGVGDRINLLEAQSRFDQAIADAVQAENELDDALSELERLTGELPDFGGHQLGDVSASDLEANWGDEQHWLEQIGNNLDVRRAAAERVIAESDTRVRRGGYYPELNFNLSYSDRQSDDEQRESEDYRASVELSVPLYRGGYTRASVRQGELRAQSSQEAVDHQRNLAAQEVRQRLRSLNGSVRRMGALQQAIESSELFVQAAERGEQLGLRDLVDVLDARASLYDQRIQYVDTLGRYVIDRLGLHSAVGALGTEDLEQVMKVLSSITPSHS